MEHPSDRLRRDQEELNRRRENRITDRRDLIRSRRIETRIRDLTYRIEAERKRISDEAFEGMWTQWSKTRTVIENCTAVAPEVRKKWLARLEMIKSSGKFLSGEQLEELASEVNGVAGGLSRIAADLRNVADCRRSSKIQRLPPLIILEDLHLTLKPSIRLPNPSARRVLPPELQFRWFDPPAGALSADLEAASGQLCAMFDLPYDLRSAWTHRLSVIDRQAMGVSVAEALEAVADEIERAAADVSSVESELKYQAAKCHRFWES